METTRIQGSQYARSLIEASLDPLFTISPEGKITDINNASINVTEVAREKLIGTDFFEYFTEPDKAREIYKKVFAEGFVADFPLTIRDGKLTEVLFNGSVYKDEQGKVIGVVVVARDITDHIRIEAELLQAKEHAEQAKKIAEEAQSKAEEATKIAENAVICKQQFLSNMSHEIRTPMNSIIGFTNVLLKTRLTAKQKEFLMAIKMSGDVLTVLINDILDLAKVNSGKMTFDQKPFKMSTSISAMIHLFEPKIQEKNLQLTKKYDPTIPEILKGDRNRLHQILNNLVSNAVKFTTKGEITVEVRLLHADKNSVTIEFVISDTGIGIPEDKIEHIFENFQQATNTTSRLYGGTGLGLAIAKQLAEQQGGSITVKSKVNEGTTFSVVLPFGITKSLVESETEIEVPVVKTRGLKVLVVEDIALNQLLVRTMLKDFGFECDLADNGRIAIEKLNGNVYDVILMDLQMPEMNGFEATKHIRERMNSHIPIIALSADVTTVNLEKCIAAGMNGYISKPIEEKLLYNKIMDSMERPNYFIDSVLDIVKPKYTDLTYLNDRTKADPLLMMDMIKLYLEQTPPLIDSMKQSIYAEDWDTLYAATHKIIPSFQIVGIHKDFEEIGKRVQEYASTRKHLDEVKDLVLQLEKVCSQACKELKKEYDLIKKNN
jgi:PAS domain S-box-containing protein